VHELSKCMTLDPGDLIITGTPSGVAAARNPQPWLKPGDVCEVEIEKIGVLRSHIVQGA
jgi:acylpyruvate hydrolase